MNDFEREVLERLARIETKMDADFRILHGNGKPGLIGRVEHLEKREAAARLAIGVLCWIAGFAVAGLAALAAWK